MRTIPPKKEDTKLRKKRTRRSKNKDTSNPQMRTENNTILINTIFINPVLSVIPKKKVKMMGF